MPTMRTEFHAQLDQLEEQLVEMAEIADEMLAEAIEALADRDPDRARAVVRRDGQVDDLYEEVQHGALRAIALQAPVASDLRLIAAILHVDIHLERMGDYATSIARMVKRSAELRDDPALRGQLQEMGEHARVVGQEAIRAFTTRDAELARRLPELDDRVDKLNHGIFHRLIELVAEDRSRMEWAENVMILPRAIERFGDHAVDIGEQAIFVVTGETIELSSNAPRRNQG